MDELPDPGSRGYSITDTDNRPVEMFVVRRDGSIYGYRNRCPHTGAPMNWQPHRFLDIDNAYIQCAMHGALFRIEDGYCLRGPCAGASLTKLILAIQAGVVVVRLE